MLNEFNPVALAIEDLRWALVDGLAPDWERWLLMLALGAAGALLGHAFFARCREESCRFARDRSAVEALYEICQRFD